eukprot:6212941-Pleurochrysis_carterae.AAC.1
MSRQTSYPNFIAGSHTMTDSSGLQLGLCSVRRFEITKTRIEATFSGLLCLQGARWWESLSFGSCSSAGDALTAVSVVASNSGLSLPGLPCYSCAYFSKSSGDTLLFTHAY